jgi:lactoylglutathione lyase
MEFVHVATRTKDLERALAFYAALGMEEVRRRELTQGKATLVFIATPERNFQIELVYNWGKDDAYAGGERFGHFAFETQRIEELEELLPALTAAGGTVLRPPYVLEGSETILAFVADPDGNSVELIKR